jgi:hypothetical protein
VLNFGVESRAEGDRAIVTVRGHVDLQVAERVVAELAKVEERAPALLVIDLSGLSFMDSSGMGVIAAAQARARWRPAAGSCSSGLHTPCAGRSSCPVSTKSSRWSTPSLRSDAGQAE